MATKKSTTTPRRTHKTPATKTAPTRVAKSDETKKDTVLRLLRRQDGASVAEIATETGWQAHSVRGFLTATVRKKLELPLISTKVEGAERRYHIGALRPSKE
jgi:hypothetical protein